VNVERLTLLGSKRDNEGSGDAQPAPQQQAAPAKAAAPQPAWNTAPLYDEEAPF
jgi:hypothetical protein